MQWPLFIHSGDRDQVEEEPAVKDQEETDSDGVEDEYVISTTPMFNPLS